MAYNPSIYSGYSNITNPFGDSGGGGGGGGAASISMTLAESFDFTAQGSIDLVAAGSASLTGSVGGASVTTLTGTSLSGSVDLGSSGLVIADAGGVLRLPLGDIITESDSRTIVAIQALISSVTKAGTGAGGTRIGYSRLNTDQFVRHGHFMGWAESTARQLFGGCRSSNGGNQANLYTATDLTTDPDAQMVVVRPSSLSSRAYYAEAASVLPEPSSDDWIQYGHVQNGAVQNDVDGSPVLQATTDFLFVEFQSTPAGLALTDLAIWIGQVPDI